MKILFTSRIKQDIYEYLHENKIGDRIIISNRTLAAEVGCTATAIHKNIAALQKEGYLEVIATGSGTLIELKEKVAI